MNQLPEKIQRAVAEQRYRMSFPVQPGDIVQVRSDDYEHAALWFVQQIHDAHFNACLCTNEVEMATEADWITHATPYRLLVQGELYGTLSYEQVIDRIAHAGPHPNHLWDLEGHDECGHRFLPYGGVDDPRRAFKSAELERHNAFVLDTRRRLLDGR